MYGTFLNKSTGYHQIGEQGKNNTDQAIPKDILGEADFGFNDGLSKVKQADHNENCACPKYSHPEQGTCCIDQQDKCA